jgi:hypothetical protein
MQRSRRGADQVGLPNFRRDKKLIGFWRESSLENFREKGHKKQVRTAHSITLSIDPARIGFRV